MGDNILDSDRNLNSCSKEELIHEIEIQRDLILSLREKTHEYESQLKISEDKVSKAFSTSPDAVNINRLKDGLFISINEGFTKIMGYNPDEVIGKTSVQLNIWADQEDRKSIVRKLLAEGKMENLEAKFVTKEHKIIDGLMSASIIDIDGESHILSITKDITERKLIENDLKKNLYLINSLMDNLSDHIYFKDTQSRFIKINNGQRLKFGLKNASEAVGKTDFDFFSDEHAGQAFSDEQEIIATGKVIAKEERETHKDKPDTWVSTVKMPLKDQNGNIVGTFGISRDITARKKAELEKQVIFDITIGLADSTNLDEFLNLVHKRLATMVYAENFFIALYDYKLNLFSFPYFVDKVDSIPAPSAMGKSCTAFVFRSGRPLLLTQESFDTLVEKKEVELVGSQSPSWVGIPLRTPAKIIGVMVLQHYEKENVYSMEQVEFLISICSQIAIAIERKQAEDEIKLKNEMLHLINAEKDKFFSIIAHDLRGPLGSFVEATKLITEGEVPMTIEEIKELTVIMKKEASSIYSLLENLLQWSRFKRGMIEFSRINIRLKERIDSSIASISESSDRKGVRIENHVSEDAVILADLNMFETIIRNLISNAVKFTPSGGTVSITAISTESGDMNIKVTDSGIGMDESLRKKLFMLSEKTSRPGTNGEPSSGLGLLLVKEFVDKHGGIISVDSEPGKGSTFSFTIPS